jgi:hypothetical protein
LPAATATTRSSEGMSNCGPFSVTACPVCALAAAAGSANSGSSRSAPSETLVIRPAGSSTWTVIPGATGTRAGSRFASISAATSVAPCRAESSTERVSATRSV